MNFIRFASLYFSFCLCFYIISSIIWLMITLLCATPKRLNVVFIHIHRFSIKGLSFLQQLESFLQVAGGIYVCFDGNVVCQSSLRHWNAIRPSVLITSDYFNLHNFGTLRTSDYVLPYVVRGLLYRPRVHVYTVLL